MSGAIALVFGYALGIATATGWHRPELIRRCALTVIALHVVATALIEVSR